MTATALALLVALFASSQAQVLDGRVRDRSGAAVTSATVTLRTTLGLESTAVTDADGRFAMPRPAGDLVISVTAPGFRPQTRSIPAGNTASLAFLLDVAAERAVVVTAGRIEQRLSDVAASVSIVDREQIDRSPAMTTDDVLRQVPAFSLFRRSSSIAAHPTAQGVSLRGIGPSGVSRTLVLLDGAPLNDPFGGWISWSRVPRLAVDTIEIVEGAGANLFGNAALGGAINLRTRQTQRGWFEAHGQYAERGTPLVEGSGAARKGAWSGLLEAGLARTDGYPVVVEQERGAVDDNVSLSARRIFASTQYAVSPNVTLLGRGDLFDESRGNGKHSTIDGAPEENSTNWVSGHAGVRVIGAGQELRAGVFGDRVRFRSNFLAVPSATPSRSIGRMTLDQFVPSSSVGATAQWTHAANAGAHFTAGADWRDVRGESREDVLDPQTGTRVVARRQSGGRQNSVGAFAQAVFAPMPRLVLTLGARHDRWRNDEGHNREQDASGGPTENDRPSLPDRSEHVTTPRAAAVIRVSDRVSAWTSIGWGFRAPTLNELYRQFRVGQVTTLANEALAAERMRAVDLGARFAPHRSTFIRVAWFDHALEDAVSNVTVSAGPSSTIQQRQNLGLTQVRGVQVDADWRPASWMVLSGGYLYNHARVREFAANPALVGKVIPQVPRHRGSAQLVLSRRAVGEATIALLAAGRQFDDDLNVRTIPGEVEPGLPGFMTVDLMLAREVRRSLSIYVGAQNLFDQRPYAGTLPTTLGSPRMATIGVRWRPSLSTK